MSPVTECRWRFTPSIPRVYYSIWANSDGKSLSDTELNNCASGHKSRFIHLHSWCVLASQSKETKQSSALFWSYFVSWHRESMRWIICDCDISVVEIIILVFVLIDNSFGKHVHLSRYVFPFHWGFNSYFVFICSSLVHITIVVAVCTLLLQHHVVHWQRNVTCNTCLTAVDILMTTAWCCYAFQDMKELNIKPLSEVVKIITRVG